MAPCKNSICSTEWITMDEKVKMKMKLKVHCAVPIPQIHHVNTAKNLSARVLLLHNCVAGFLRIYM